MKWFLLVLSLFTFNVSAAACDSPGIMELVRIATGMQHEGDSQLQISYNLHQMLQAQDTVPLLGHIAAFVSKQPKVDAVFLLPTQAQENAENWIPYCRNIYRNPAR